MIRPLRIAVDARPLAFPNSGIGRYTACLLREFAVSNIPHSFMLYCDRPTQPPFALPPHWKLRAGNVTRRALSTPFAQTIFPLWAQADQVDVFWSPRHHLPLLLPHSIRKVVTVHDMVWKRFPDTMTNGGRLIESLLMPASLHRANNIIAVSQFTQREITTLFPAVAGRVKVIYEASALSSEAASVSVGTEPPLNGRPYFLFVGTSEPRKNLARLLEAFKNYVGSSGNALDLVVAGSYQWGKFDVQRFIEQNNLGNRVHLRKELTDHALANLYRHARALVMPSLYEGFGLPLVEAMQWGLPIITSKDSAMSEIADSAALIVDPQDKASIRRALEELSGNQDLRALLAANATARSAQFDWHRAASQTLEVLCQQSPQ